MDDRLVKYFGDNASKGSDEILLKAVGSDEARAISDPYGGFLIPPAYSPDLLKIEPENDPIGSRVRVVPMGSPIVKITARVDKNHTSSVSGGLTVTRKPETVAGTPSQMEFEQVTLEAHTLFGLSYATEEILRDSPISFTALLASGFSDQFIYHMIKERLYGTGVGEFLGVLTALDASSLGPTISIVPETGQPADTIVYENVLKMRAQCWGYSKAVWLANHDTMPQLMLLNQAVGVGGLPVWQPSAREDHPDMLLGRPLFFSEYAKTIGDQGDIGIYNWNEYLEGTLQPMQNEESIHVRFVNHERAFKFWMRNAGAPWWRTALTPAFSTKKLSPFVVLDAR
jgi:HK97 family phage major capsid protein